MQEIKTKNEIMNEIVSVLYGQQWTVALLGGDIMVTWDALSCVFTFGILLVAVIALFNGKKQLVACKGKKLPRPHLENVDGVISV